MEQQPAHHELAFRTHSNFFFGTTMKNGFALVLSLMFLLILTLFALILLAICGSYYASAKNFHENENARIACEQSARLMVDTHNLESATPRFFHDPSRWQGQNLIPFSWNEYTVKGYLDTAWNNTAANFLRVDVQKGRYNSSLDLQVTQIRLEEFAVYTNSPQTLNRASLIDGRVFAPNGITLELPIVRFRNFVQGVITPELNATFRRKTDHVFAYPDLIDVRTLDDFFQAALTDGLLVTARNPLFWNGVEYELNLDQLMLQPQAMQWHVVYNGTDLGVIRALQFWFDDAVRIRQTYSAVAHLTDSKTVQPVYFSSSSNIFLDSSLQPVESVSYRHPICITSGGSISVSTFSPALVRIHALLIAFGNSIYQGIESGLIVEPGSNVIPSEQIDTWKTEIGRSAFLVEPEHRQNLLSAIQNGGKAVWFQDTIALSSAISVADDVNEIHFASSKFQYPFLPSFPFVMILEGSQQWH
jgi:hypothetical protein